MSFLELLQPQGDKATLNEIIKVKKLLPASVTKAIPACLYADNGELDEEVLIAMSLIRAQRENKDITAEEVGDRIGNKNADMINPIIKELIYFFTTNTKEEVEQRFAEAESESEEVDTPAEDPTA